MSDEHAPLRLLRQVFGDDITGVVGDEPDRADVRTATFGDVRLIAEAHGCTARVGGGDFCDAGSMEDALRDAVADRSCCAITEIRRLQREVATLIRLHIPVPE